VIYSQHEIVLCAHAKEREFSVRKSLFHITSTSCEKFTSNSKFSFYFATVCTARRLFWGIKQMCESHCPHILRNKLYYTRVIFGTSGARMLQNLNSCKNNRYRSKFLSILQNVTLISIAHPPQ